MKKDSYTYDSLMRKKMSEYTPKADYGKAMRLYKIFGYSSLSILAAVYILFRVL